MKQPTKSSIVFIAGALLCLSLASCPKEASYPSTITPIYAATDSGLLVYNGSGWTNYTASNVLASNNLSSVAVSGSGSEAEVFAGSDAGISYFDGSTCETWTTSNGLGGNTVNGLFLGTGLCAATEGGISMYEPSSDTWTNDTSCPAANCVYKYGRFTFVGTDSGLYVYNGTSLLKHYTTGEGLASDTVNAVIGYSASNIYAGTSSGLSAYDSSTGKFKTKLGSAINGLAVDSNNYLYAATDDGLYLFLTSTWQYAYFPDLQVSQKILCVYVDGAGNVYAGTDTDLEEFKNGSSVWTVLKSGYKFKSIATTAPLYSF
jgi:ligand-binding sensor domain-containing protein